ncbi:MAG: pantetheine-phosphate adenylyltransferase [Clostridiales Family XIII bacterium]|jgi:pantetheine-phosphate adenylyltransferase|nr:pantetheine-phosphate adenylyltransferase [Clostridiales Family XIII bacterium]
MRELLLYAGSFDPITNGHLDLIIRGSRLCERMIIGVIRNRAKDSRFPLDDRAEMIRLATSHLKNVSIDCFDGLLADYVKEKGVSAVLRGLRATMDFEYEMQMAQMNARLYGDEVETLFLMTCPEYSFVSSSIVNEVFRLGGDISGLVPDAALAHMRKICPAKKQRTSVYGSPNGGCHEGSGIAGRNRGDS